MKIVTSFLIICLLACTVGVTAQVNPKNKAAVTAQAQSFIKKMRAAQKAASKASNMRVSTEAMEPDSAIGWTWDTTAHAFTDPSFRGYFISYDANNNATEVILQFWNDSNFVNAIMEIDSFDVNNNVVSEFEQQWNNTIWVNVSLYKYTYAQGNKALSDTSFQWTGSAWQQATITEYYYDGNGNQVADTIFSGWDGTAYENGYFDNYTYDGSNNKTEHVVSTLYDSVITASDRYLYTYDTQNHNTSAVHEQWNGSSYALYQMDTMVYDNNNNMIQDTRLFHDNFGWVYWYNDIYAYDNRHNRVSDIYQAPEGGWVNISRDTITYDASNNLLNSLTQLWDGSGFAADTTLQLNILNANEQLLTYADYVYNAGSGGIASGDSSEYYYNDIPTAVKGLTENKGIVIYPDPATTSLTVALNGMKEGMMQIYDVSGRQVGTTQAITSDALLQNINIAALDAGVYFLSIREADGTVVKQFVKE